MLIYISITLFQKLNNQFQSVYYYFALQKKSCHSKLTGILTFLVGIYFFSALRIKGALSGLRQFLAAESPLKVMRNAFYFTSKALFVLKIFKFLS